MAQIEKKQKTDRFPVIRLMDFQDEIERIREHNPQYDLSLKELADQGLAGERIYENIYRAQDVKLIPAEKSAANKPAADKAAADKPTADKAAADKPAAEPDAVLVVADGKQIGFIKPGACAAVREILEKNTVRSISLDLKGGNYKILTPDENDSFSIEHETVLLYGSVVIASEEKKTSDAAGTSGGTKSYIDTTYALAENREDSRKRGFIPLLLAAIVTAFYLSFSIPYWYFIHQGKEPVFTFISELLQERDIFYHLCAMLAALLFSIISMASRSRFLVFLTMLCYAGSAGYLVYVTKDPWYVLPGALQVFLCFIALIRKRGA